LRGGKSGADGVRTLDEGEPNLRVPPGGDHAELPRTRRLAGKCLPKLALESPRGRRRRPDRWAPRGSGTSVIQRARVASTRAPRVGDRKNARARLLEELGCAVGFAYWAEYQHRAPLGFIIFFLFISFSFSFLFSIKFEF
jgi:hypothetical protein